MRWGFLVVVASLLVVGAAGCGDGSTSIVASEPCSVTTIPDTVGGPPPCPPETSAEAVACAGLPAGTPATPAGGWIGDGAVPGFPHIETRQVAAVWDLDGAVRDAGFDPTTAARRSEVTEFCDPDAAVILESRLEGLVLDLPGGTLSVELSQLVAALDVGQLATDTGPVTLDDGSQLMRSDLFADHSLRTVWFVTPTGLLAKVRAEGHNAPSVSGWPTTMPVAPTSSPPEPAPLDLDQMEAIARDLVAAN